MAKKKQIRVKVHGQRRTDVDTRRMAKAIVRLAVGLDTAEAQELADALDQLEAERRMTLKRARAEEREADDLPVGGPESV